MALPGFILLAALATVAALVVLAVSWTGPATLQPGETITRGAYLTQGDYTLSVTADGPGEAAAMESMVSLIESGFGEEE